MQRAGGGRTRGWVVGHVVGAPVVVSPGWVLAAVVLTVVVAPVVRSWVRVGDGEAYVVAAVFVLGVLLSVFLHELGHAVVARRRGVPVRELAVTLLGGHTQLGSAARTPATSAAVAVAGPAVNLALAGTAWLAAQLAPAGVPTLLLSAVALANAVVGLFNLVPGLPLDGGRVLEAVLWRATGRRATGTLVAGWAGRVLVLALVGWALLPLAGGAPPDVVRVLWVALVGAFLWSGAGDALRAGRAEGAVEAVRVADLMEPAAPLPAGATVLDLDTAVPPGVAAVLVASDGRPVALVDAAAAGAVPAAVRPTTPLVAVAVPLAEAAVVERGLEGPAAVNVVAGAARTSGVLAVVHGGTVVGVLRTTDVIRWLRGRT